MKKNGKIILTVLLCVAFFARLLPAVILHYPVINDAAQYDSIAQNLVENGSYSRDGGMTPSIERPPGYPFFLAAIYAFSGHDTGAAIFVQVLIGTLVVYLTYLLSARLFDDSKYAYITAAGVAVYPMFIYYNLFLYSENFAVVSLLLSLILLFYSVKNNKSAYLFWSGLAYIVFILTKPLFAFSVFFVLAYLIYYRQKINLLRAVVLFILPVIILWGLWIGRNYAAFHEPIPFGIGIGPVLFAGNYPPFKAVVPDDYNDILTAAGVTSSVVSNFELDGILKDKATAMILSNPQATANLFLLKSFKYLYIVKDISKSTIYRQGTESSQSSSRVFTLLFCAYKVFKAVISLLYVAGCIFALYFLRKKKAVSAEIILIVALTLYALVFHALLYVDERYHLPTFCLHIIIAVFALRYLFDIYINRLKRVNIEIKK